VHVTTDQRSRTMLMDLETLSWDDELAVVLQRAPADAAGHQAVSCPECYGKTTKNGPFAGEVALTGDLGDQQAHRRAGLLQPGEAKNTYGTGNSCC